MTDSLTITSLSLKILYTKYKSDKLIIPSITNKELYKEMKNSYYGARVEVYKPYGKNLFYYDVNSLYPTIMRNNPMPVGNPSLIEGRESIIQDILNDPLRRNLVLLKQKYIAQTI